MEGNKSRKFLLTHTQKKINKIMKEEMPSSTSSFPACFHCWVYVSPITYLAVALTCTLVTPQLISTLVYLLTHWLTPEFKESYSKPSNHFLQGLSLTLLLSKSFSGIRLSSTRSIVLCSLFVLILHLLRRVLFTFKPVKHIDSCLLRTIFHRHTWRDEGDKGFV